MRFPHAILVAVTAAALIDRPLSAQAAARALTLDDAVATAMRENPDVRLARLRGDSSLAEVRIARSYANPALAVAPNNPWQYSVAAPLDVGPQRTYRVRAASSGAAASSFDTRDAERLAKFAVRAAFYDVILADTIRAITGDSYNIFRDLLAADSARVRSGDSPERNLARSELELAKAGADLARARAAARSARFALQLAMGITRPDTALAVDGSLEVRPLPDLDASPDDSTIARRPDVRAAATRTRASAESRSFASALLVPVPGLVLVQQRDEPFPNGQHYAFGVSAQIPVWNWFSGERERAAAGERASLVSEQRVRAQARAEVDAAQDQFRAARLLAASLDAALIAKARASLETARFAYTSGATSYVDFLDALRTYNELRVDAATAGHDYWVSAYAVMRALDFDTVRQ